jgi:hypothetical protein
MNFFETTLGMSAFGAFIVVALGIAGQSDYEMELEQERMYCEMTTMWLDDEARGIPVEQRRGWPTYNPDITCNY